MRAGGLKENITAKEFMSHLKRPNILEIGSMASFMEQESLIGLMEVFTEENGKIVENMVTVNLLELMEQYMKENGRMAAIMEKED